MDNLGIVLMIWAQDDETDLVGGLSAALTDTGHRVVCVTATRGEAGVSSSETRPSTTSHRPGGPSSMPPCILGIDEHHWLDYPDGGCADLDEVKAADRIAVVFDDVGPDTVITFGPDGFTGQPDHKAVSRRTDLAVAHASRGPSVLHAVAREEVGLERFRAWVATESFAEPKPR